MSKSFLCTMLVSLSALFIAGCNASNQIDTSITNNPAALDDSYIASTPEARQIIDQLKKGIVQMPGVVTGGVTDAMMKQRIDERMNPLYESTGDTSTIQKSVQPSSLPTTAATRPKISWVGKLGGPGEYYILNSTTKINPSNVAPNSVMHQKSTTWYKTAANRTTYYTALIQDTGIKTNTIAYGTDWGGYCSKICSLNHTFEGINEFQLDVVLDYTSVQNHYAYGYVAASVFEDSNAYPIQETWYWNPPWHFEKLCTSTNNSGNFFYGADTCEGYEEQTLIYRWDVNDFNNAYSNTYGWHYQGWYIKDLDVENGVVSAILYKPAEAYTESIMLNVTETYFNNRIGNVLWPAGYRGLLIDSSW
jgi:hypothetical protein